MPEPEPTYRTDWPDWWPEVAEALGRPLFSFNERASSDPDSVTTQGA